MEKQTTEKNMLTKGEQLDMLLKNLYLEYDKGLDEAYTIYSTMEENPISKEEFETVLLDSKKMKRRKLEYLSELRKKLMKTNIKIAKISDAIDIYEYNAKVLYTDLGITEVEGMEKQFILPSFKRENEIEQEIDALLNEREILLETISSTYNAYEDKTKKTEKNISSAIEGVQSGINITSPKVKAVFAGASDKLNDKASDFAAKCQSYVDLPDPKEDDKYININKGKFLKLFQGTTGKIAGALGAVPNFVDKADKATPNILTKVDNSVNKVVDGAIGVAKKAHVGYLNHGLDSIDERIENLVIELNNRRLLREAGVKGLNTDIYNHNYDACAALGVRFRENDGKVLTKVMLGKKSSK